MGSSHGRWIASTLALALVPAPALAGPVERLTQVLLHRAHPDVIAVRYENGGGGIVVSRDGGRSFQLLCGAAMNLEGERVTSAALSGDGELVFGTFTRMLRDDGRGCSFASDPTLEGRWVTDIVAHPSDAAVTFAVTGNAEPEENGVFRRGADGDYARFGSFAPRLITRLRIALLPDGGLRLYQSALHGTTEVDTGGSVQTVPNYVLRVSDDDGATWLERPFASGGGAMRLEAVDPRDPNRIVVSAVRPDGLDAVLVSEDAGATFREYARVAVLAGLVVTGQGRVFIADAGDPAMPDLPAGLWRGESLDAEPVRLPGSDRVLCLGHDDAGDRLYGCGAYTFGILDPDRGTLAPLLDFRAVESFVACDGVDMPGACESQLRPAYCHVSHFPCAPVCAAYPIDPALLKAAGCTEPLQPPAAVSDAGLADAASVNGTHEDAGQPAQDAARNEQPQEHPGPAPAVCSAGAPGSAPHAHSAGASLPLVLAGLFARSRRRIRRAARFQRVQRSGESSSPPPGSR
jgi:hypothetical protein